MLECSLQWLAEQCNGRLVGADISVNTVFTDTRKAASGGLFVALSGARFDAHDFIDEAVNNGATALCVNRTIATSVPYILVEDTRVALGLIGAAVKRKIAPKSVAITGSCGKTTVKEMTAAILAQVGNVWATQGNFNNDIGVPLTLLSLTPEHTHAVFELGANHQGEIAYTTALCQPDAAVITNVAPSHLEGFGSVAGVAKAKAEIYAGLGETGTALVNIDSEFSDNWLSLNQHRQVVTVSVSGAQKADYYPQHIQVQVDGTYQFELVTPEQSFAITLPITGPHNVGNAVIAAALAMQCDAKPSAVVQGLSSMQAVQGRGKIFTLHSQLRLIDDSYNANVASVKAAIDTLASLPGQSIVVLGDMLELGDNSSQYHADVGRYAALKGIDKLYCIGEYAEHIALGFDTQNSAGNAQLCADIETLNQALVSELHSLTEQPCTVLVKGSRGAKMERVVAALMHSSLHHLTEEQPSC